MAGEWRVKVSLPKRSRAEENQSWTTAMRTLRSRISNDIKVSQSPRSVFLGLSVARRWKYLIVGASCEDDAHALADQIRGYSSIGTRIRVQPGVYDIPPVQVSQPGDGVGSIWI